MVVQRREVWWAEPGAAGSEPGFRRPVLIVQADAFNRSRLRTTLAVVLTSNTRLLDAPGNVLLPGSDTGLPKDSVANVTPVITLDADYLVERAGRISADRMSRVEAGLRPVLEL